MCETRAAFSKAFADWAPDLEGSRLSTRERDLRTMSDLCVRPASPGHGLPDAGEEEAASALLMPLDRAISERFGLDPVTARYVLCSGAIETGRPIVSLAEGIASAMGHDAGRR